MWLCPSMIMRALLRRGRTAPAGRLELRSNYAENHRAARWRRASKTAVAGTRGLHDLVVTPAAGTGGSAGPLSLRYRTCGSWGAQSVQLVSVAGGMAAGAAVGCLLWVAAASSPRAAVSRSKLASFSLNERMVET